jgi:catechol 2,3-dioxygenase-like lactoylglutathione lyase family enzyme
MEALLRNRWTRPDSVLIVVAARDHPRLNHLAPMGTKNDGRSGHRVGLCGESSNVTIAAAMSMIDLRRAHEPPTAGGVPAGRAHTMHAMATSFGQVRLHHVQILAPPHSEAATRRFYGSLLGLREITKPAALSHDGVWFELADGAQLHVGILRERDEPTRNRAHFALQVESLDELAGRLTEAGIACTVPNPVPGWRRIQLRDPFGNGIEILQVEAS